MKNLILSLLFILFTNIQSQAAHVFGTMLSYRCLGNSQYEVTLTLYRDCGGVVAPISANININSYSCNQSLPAVALALDSSLTGDMVTPFCNTFAGNASCNGGNLPSEDVAVYKGIITLPAQCPDWVISFSFGVRSSYYTNLVNPSSNNIYIEALIDNSFGVCYDSPTFKNHPMLYACAGRPFYYDMGAWDNDGDTLKYTLLAPLTSATQNASFQSGLSVNNPLVMQAGAGNGLVFNTRTGDLTFRPQNGSNQFAALTIRVDKWHGGKIVASTMAEMDIIVSSFCSNSPIRETEINTPSSGWHFDDTLDAFVSCNGDNPFSFSVSLEDLNGDSIRVDTQSSTNFNTVFGPGNWTSLFFTFSRDSIMSYWSIFFPLPTFPPSGGVPTFTIGFSDAVCPYTNIKKVIFRGFIAFAKAAASNDILCEGQAQTVQFGVSGTGNLTNILWEQIPNGAPMIPLSNPNIPNPTIAVPPLASGTTLRYIVSAKIDSCVVWDTIALHVIDTPNINLSVVNASSAGASDGTITASSTGYLNQFDYHWQSGSTNNSIQNLGIGNYALTVTDFHGCQSVATANVSFGSNISNYAKEDFLFKIFPNPSLNKKFQIEFSQNNYKDIQIEIFNLLGQTIPFESSNFSLGIDKFEIAVSQAVAGIYYLKLTVDGEVYSQKIILE